MRDGIHRTLTPDAEAKYARFLEQYLALRRAGFDAADGRGTPYGFFEKHALHPRIEALGRPPRVVDLGAGTGLLSERLAERGCRPVAVDLIDDPQFGLGAAAARSFPRFQADFDDLPFADAQFDLAVFSASFHYSVDYEATLRETRRVLDWGGRVAILGTPVYRTFAEGQRAADERHAQVESRLGFRPDALPSMEFLDRSRLDRIAGALNLRWRIRKPWFGLADSRTWLLEGRWTD